MIKLLQRHIRKRKSYDSSIAPKGFVLDSEIPEEQDAVKVMDKYESLTENEKQKISNDVIDLMNKY